MSTHDRRLKAVPTARSLEAVIGEARRRFPEPDCVIWTGDLSHEHSQAGYQLLHDLAGDWAEISLLLPGNHDDRAALRSVFVQVPGETGEEVCFRQDLGDWLLIGLDTHIPGKIEGALSDAAIDLLDSWLSQDQGRLALIFMHHPPGPVGSAWIDDIGLHNPEPLRSVLSRAPGVKGIFCGHVHQVFDGKFARAGLHTAPATSFQFMPGVAEFRFDLIPPGFRTIRLDGDKYTTEVIRTKRLECVPEDTQD